MSETTRNKAKELARHSMGGSHHHTVGAISDMVSDVWQRESLDAEHLAHQRKWSEQTFGPGDRIYGVLDHIRKELQEVANAYESREPTLPEWVDIIILAFDGAWRSGAEPQEIIDAIKVKQAKNEARVWPDWREMSQDQAIEHDRSED